MTSTASERVAALIAESNGGNVRTAAYDIGCSYQPLLRLVNGTARRGPSLTLVIALARYYQKPLEYFYDEDADD